MCTGSVARAGPGLSGIAVSLANHSDRGMMRQIERFTGAAIPTSVIPGLEPRGRAHAGADAHRHSRKAPGLAGSHASRYQLRSREELVAAALLAVAPMQGGMPRASAGGRRDRDGSRGGGFGKEERPLLVAPV
jgi:hypothetical protein